MPNHSNVPVLFDVTFRLLISICPADVSSNHEQGKMAATMKKGVVSWLIS